MLGGGAWEGRELGGGVLGGAFTVLRVNSQAVCSCDSVRRHASAHSQLNIQASLAAASVHSDGAQLTQTAACVFCRNSLAPRMLLFLSCRFIPLLGELLDCPHTGLRCAATDVLIEIVSKRMEPTAKISLVQQLKVLEACERLSTNLVMAAGASKVVAAAASSRAGQGGGDGSSDGSAAAAAAAGQQLAQDEELLAKYAKLLATLAGEVMDALKRIENGECGSAHSACCCCRLCEIFPLLGAALRPKYPGMPHTHTAMTCTLLRGHANAEKQ